RKPRGKNSVCRSSVLKSRVAGLVEAVTGTKRERLIGSKHSQNFERERGVMIPKHQAVLLFLMAGASWAQTTATIVGTVTDSSGAVVANAKGTVPHKATGTT